MLTYEYLVEKLRTHNPRGTFHYKETTVEPWRIAVAGACAGMVSWLPAIPFDVIKTRMMTESDPKRFKSVWHCYNVITKVSENSMMSNFINSYIIFLTKFIGFSIHSLQESGYRSLFRGGTVLVLRSAPVSAVSFIGYEYMLRYCQSYQNYLRH